MTGPIAGRRRRTAAVVAAVLACTTALTGPHLAATGAGTASTALAPQLEWKPCAQDRHYDCATATVPLDYANPRGRTIELSVVKRKATGPGRRVGTLFFNPGGPGGPGSVQMPQIYESFPDEVRERFDIVSWDPRGIGNSTAVNCFESTKEAEAWTASHPAGFPVGERERKKWVDSYRELGRACERRDPELLRHVSTADTARDLEQLRRSVGESLLTYIGISYGTFLGATYANLYPDKVRAMVLDSNVDPSAWTNGGSEQALLPYFQRLGSDRSAAATLDRFLSLCGAATVAECAFSAGSAQATLDKFKELTERLRERPVESWTYARTVSDVVSALYVVHPGWADLAARLQDLWQGQAPAAPAAPATTPPVPTPYGGDEQAAAVLCGDSPSPRDPGVFHATEEAAAARSGDAARHWTWAAEPCATWPATAADPYTGPWNKRTAHPLLVVGTSYDPATPYESAEAMSETLADARLLTNRGYGHTALLNPSGCVNDHVSRYLLDGALPPPGTTCEQDTPPFSARHPRGAVDAGAGGTRR
ncbi:alpha/beta fold hydrolase [Streptomyces spinoverrucosus]|uniref:alpha/beta hydrolase n=1 Tax=Streptomyces spinoverrucosus TaxID=284043 RepID=UPI0018C3877A|nr:alpha/beta hydrolase [Streptomyces spinoverrucosus]MBG0850538.1 alpha/beta fold hydrolase [Streptomyces spinoverrucosus]